MNYLDVHCHILPNIDDGARDLDTSLQMLEILKQQGVTDVVATPHFYPDSMGAEEFVEKANQAFETLCAATREKDLPRLHLGCELHYFSGIGKSRALSQFAIKGTRYILLELSYNTPITKTVLQDIINMYEYSGITPILAHIERYRRLAGYKKLLKLISDGAALGQINAAAVISKEDGRACEKLIKGGFVSFLASDAHSPDKRPPFIEAALRHITERLGKSVANRLVIKSNRLLEEIEGINENF